MNKKDIMTNRLNLSQHLSGLCRLEWAACFILSAFAVCGSAESASLSLKVEQITFGPRHHFFGYIGQSKTIPWNAGGRYILALRVGYHDHMPGPGDAADVVLIDTEQANKVVRVDQTRAWNFQQGTMFYWNPASPRTQFFFNDRDPATNRIYTVLFDIGKNKRLREFRYPDTPVGNSGVAQDGSAFLAINYGRMARLRPVTGYPGGFDWTTGQKAPDSDGIFIIDPQSGEKRLLVSFRKLAELVRPTEPDVDKASLYINHTLWNRPGDRIYFYVRGRLDRSSMKINVPCTIKPDGTALTAHSTFIGGHPEWGRGNRIIGQKGDRQVLYDVDKKEIVGRIATPEIIPKPGGDISLSPDANWFVNGFGSKDGKNYYVFVRRADGAHIRSQGFSRGPYLSGELRIDPAPRWNRTNDAILVPGYTEEGTRQMFIIRISEK
ncbi:MAG: hypothetical protein CEE38_08625 [Planctomycetes bacterium B3_Pla]|nr:MAG: hypothetical protein CEE38_08625 [Planctomycetes bacterium B3_Pla]